MIAITAITGCDQCGVVMVVLGCRVAARHASHNGYVRLLEVMLWLMSVGLHKALVVETGMTHLGTYLVVEQLLWYGPFRKGQFGLLRVVVLCSEKWLRTVNDK